MGRIHLPIFHHADYRGRTDSDITNWAFQAIIGSLNMGLTQLLVPDHIRGRVMSIMMMTHSFMPMALCPSAQSQRLWDALAIMLSGTLVGLSLLAIRLWLPELNSIKDNFDSQPASNLSTADKSNNF